MIMKKITLTGEQAYDMGRQINLYRKNLDSSYELISFESHEADGFIIARDERDSAVIMRENRIYTFHTK